LLPMSSRGIPGAIMEDATILQLKSMENGWISRDSATF
jgi:hypothetical protein